LNPQYLKLQTVRFPNQRIARHILDLFLTFYLSCSTIFWLVFIPLWKELLRESQKYQSYNWEDSATISEGGLRNKKKVLHIKKSNIKNELKSYKQDWL